MNPACADPNSVPTGRFKLIAAATAGNLFEWYDWSVFGFLVTYIGINFFPSSSPVASLLMSFASFGAGFLVRPLGAVVIGYLAEVRGRRVALLATLIIMGLGTVPIALLPNVDRIGLWAPTLLIVCRLLQGFSTGGELGGSLAFLAEWAPAADRGSYISLQQASTHGGTLLGAIVASGLNALLDVEQMTQWGWRIPFLIGGLVLPVALLLRWQLRETPAYLDYRANARAARKTARVAGNIRRLGMASCLIAGPVACQYLFFTYMASFAVRHGGLSQAAALASNALGLAVLVILIPLTGAWSDRLGRRPLLAAASLAIAAAAAPVFAIVGSVPGMPAVLLTQACMAALIALYHGSGPAAVVELFPMQDRVLMVSLSYAVGVALFGGFAPFAAVWLVDATGSTLAPAAYAAASCCLTGAAALWIKESARRQLA